MSNVTIYVGKDRYYTLHKIKTPLSGFQDKEALVRFFNLESKLKSFQVGFGLSTDPIYHLATDCTGLANANDDLLDRIDKLYINNRHLILYFEELDNKSRLLKRYRSSVVRVGKPTKSEIYQLFNGKLASGIIDQLIKLYDWDYGNLVDIAYRLKALNYELPENYKIPFMAQNYKIPFIEQILAYAKETLPENKQFDLFEVCTKKLAGNCASCITTNLYKYSKVFVTQNLLLLFAKLYSYIEGAAIKTNAQYHLDLLELLRLSTIGIYRGIDGYHSLELFLLSLDNPDYVTTALKALSLISKRV